MNISEILEKGLMVGFGLIVLSMLFGTVYQGMLGIYNHEKMRNFDDFKSTLEDCIHNPDKYKDGEEIPCYLIEEINFTVKDDGLHHIITICSISKCETINSSHDVSFNPNSISGYFSIIVHYQDSYTQGLGILIILEVSND
jgi:hypothetical protein